MQNAPDQFKGKGIGMNLGRQVVPPFGGVLSLVAEDSTKLAGVPENKASAGLPKDQGIVLGGWVCRILLEKPTGHSEMDAEPSFPRKAKEHFLAVGFGSLQGASFESPLDKGWIKLPEYPGSVLRLDLEDLMSFAFSPCLGGKQDFREFWHFAFRNPDRDREVRVWYYGPFFGRS